MTMYGCVCPFFSIPGGKGWSANEHVTFLQFTVPRFLLAGQMRVPGNPDLKRGLHFFFLSQAKFASTHSFLQDRARGGVLTVPRPSPGSGFPQLSGTVGTETPPPLQ